MKNLSNIQIRLVTSSIIVGVVVLLSPQIENAQQTPPAAAPLSSTVRAILNQGIAAGRGIGQFDNSRCTLVGNPAGNINLRCDEPIHALAETAIAVDPNDPNHLLVGANNFNVAAWGSQIAFFVSFDGGSAWTSGQIPANGGGAADPSPAFNAKFGTVHMGHVGIGCSLGCTISAEVSTSNDGGLTWGNPVAVARGEGQAFVSQNWLFNDKPWLVCDNNPGSPHYGRLYLTWTRIGPIGNSYTSPIYFSYSDDGGKRWSREVEISGSNTTFCTSITPGVGNRCSDDQFSTPVVLPNGDLVVHFQNRDNSSAWDSPFDFDSQTMVVRSTDGGSTWSGPLHIADLEDTPVSPPGNPFSGPGDYPIDELGLTTQTGHQLKTWSVQGMTSDPVTGDLYAFWTDNRDGVHDSFTPITATNVFMTKSTDGGFSWIGPTRITSGPGDRWMPWGAAYGGVVKVMFLDGSYDYPNRTLYGVTLASSSDGGGSWNFERVDTAPSNPNNSFWFISGASDCPKCTYFIGDYQGLTMDSLGRAHLVWTDMRRNIGNPSAKAHDIDYARR